MLISSIFVWYLQPNHLPLFLFHCFHRIWDCTDHFLVLGILKSMVFLIKQIGFYITLQMWSICTNGDLEIIYTGRAGRCTHSRRNVLAISWTSFCKCQAMIIFNSVQCASTFYHNEYESFVTAHTRCCCPRLVIILLLCHLSTYLIHIYHLTLLHIRSDSPWTYGLVEFSVQILAIAGSSSNLISRNEIHFI